MKMMIAAVMAIGLLVLLLIPQLKKYKGIILAAYGFVFMLLVAVQTYRTVGGILPFYQPKEQTFYQSDFAGEGLYPDALIQLLVKGKTVYVKDDLDEYMSENIQDNAFMKDGKYWLYPRYHQVNLVNFLEASGANVVADAGYNNIIMDSIQESDFEFAGYGNDMFRFMFQLCKEKAEWGNYFYFYWYYSSYLKEMNIYINPKGITEDNELVILWNDQENETLHIMTKQYFDEEVAPNA